MTPLGRQKWSRLERSIALRRSRFERVVALREEARKTWDKLKSGVTVNVRHESDYRNAIAGDISFTESYVQGEHWYDVGLTILSNGTPSQYVAIIEHPTVDLLQSRGSIGTDDDLIRHLDIGCDQRDPSVLVQVGQVPEGSKEPPLAVIQSVVWLKRLHVVSNVRPDIPQTQGFDVKLGRPIEDGELGVLVIDRRVDRSRRISEVVEGGTEIVNEIAENQGNVGRWVSPDDAIPDIFAALTIELAPNVIGLTFRGFERSDCFVERIEMFPRPFNLEPGIAERMHEIDSHHGEQRKDAADPEGPRNPRAKARGLR